MNSKTNRYDSLQRQTQRNGWNDISQRHALGWKHEMNESRHMQTSYFLGFDLSYEQVREVTSHKSKAGMKSYAKIDPVFVRALTNTLLANGTKDGIKDMIEFPAWLRARELGLSVQEIEANDRKSMF